MYEWIVDGLSSLFVPFSGEKSAAWPSEHGNGIARAAGTDSQRQENSRPAKRNYQSVYSADGVAEYPEVKRARHDVIIRVVKKTFAGIAGLFRSRQRRKDEHEKQKGFTQVGRVAYMGIDDIYSNSLSSWIEIDGMDKQTEMGLKNKERTATNVHHNVQALRKPDGAMLYKGSQDRGREMRRSLKLVPSCTTHGLSTRPPEMEHPSRTHKPCLTVEEALRESDREHYRKLVEMASEKYSKSKPLPFGRMKPPISNFPLDGHKANGHTSFSCTTDVSRPAPVRALPNMSVWREPVSLMQTKDRTVDFNRTTPGSDVKQRALDNQTARKFPVDVDLSAEVEARLNLKEKDTAAGPLLPSRSELITDSVRRSEEEFPRLTKEMQQEVSAALAQSDPNLVLCSAFKLRITQRDLATLQEGSWLNDEVINFYMNLVMSRGEQEVGSRKVYSFSTFLFPKLHGGGHASVRRWTKAVDLFLYDIILVPLHLGVHWSLAVVDLKTKSVLSYDSMGQRHDDICNMILLYLKEEFKVKKGKDLDLSKWTLSSLRPSEIPQQKNGSDCGVFICKYADYISRGRSLTFRQNHMPYFRKVMIWEILNQKLLQ
ncbi:sentrin-specific protease 2 isoform X2 [Pimephales promelas]|uniref:sentrin-specific protease 2 isoform X2 n=1 Tax=Pimephales promelas TaxID=90988 RepID=UPI001955A071|nr:sentrin-specific protease 2 isoform X2 [Pimephales promelas]KAG1942364.1 sentrin-specific protease [Pimephales promelas]